MLAPCELEANVARLKHAEASELNIQSYRFGTEERLSTSAQSRLRWPLDNLKARAQRDTHQLSSCQSVRKGQGQTREPQHIFLVTVELNPTQGGGLTICVLLQIVCSHLRIRCSIAMLQRNWRRTMSDANQVFDLPQIIILSQPRSGTHFIETALASHPDIRPRGECFLRYKRYMDALAVDKSAIVPHAHVFHNSPCRTNVGILMYNMIGFFESTWGSLTSQRLIHLLRNPKDIAASVAQKLVDSNYYKDSYRSHYRITHTPLLHQPIDRSLAAAMEKSILIQQRHYINELATYPHVLTVDYDLITGNQQTFELDDGIATMLLGFIGISYHKLTTNLLKTGVSLD